MAVIEEKFGDKFEMKDGKIVPILSKPMYAVPDSYENDVHKDIYWDKKKGDKVKNEIDQDVRPKLTNKEVKAFEEEEVDNLRKSEFSHLLFGHYLLFYNFFCTGFWPMELFVRLAMLTLPVWGKKSTSYNETYVCDK